MPHDLSRRARRRLPLGLALAALTACAGAAGSTGPAERAGAGAGADPQAAVTVTGVLTDEGVECPALRAGDGALYTLAGDVGAVRPGERVRVTGTVAAVSFCMQGTTLAVERIERAP